MPLDCFYVTENATCMVTCNGTCKSLVREYFPDADIVAIFICVANESRVAMLRCDGEGANC